MTPPNDGRDPAAIETPPARPVDSARGFGDAPEADIPELKKKEEERRGAGVPGYAGSGSGGSGLAFGVGGGARVGSSFVAANPGLLGSGRIAAALARFFGGRATFLGGLFASKAGAPLVLAGMLGWGMMLGAAALKLMGGFNAADTGLSSTAAGLSGMAPSGIMIDAPKDRSLGYLAQANEGELAWDQEKKEEPKEAPAGEPVEEAQAEAPAPEVPKFEMPNVDALMNGKAGLDRNAFAKKLANDGKAQAGLGNNAGFDMKKSLGGTKFTPRDLGANRKATALKRVRNKLSARNLSTLAGRSSRAMGQLKLSRNMSASGVQASNAQQARQFETDAFEQGRTIGGELQGIDAGGATLGASGGLGSGANDLSPPPVGPSGNVTPYQDKVDAAKNMGNNSAMLKMAGIAMIIMGTLLVASGTVLKSNHTTLPIGIALVAAGMALIGLGIAMLGMSGQQKDAAKQQGDQIDKQHGQKDQGDAIDNCADQANADGTKTENCQADPMSSPEALKHKADQQKIKEAVGAERNATYSGVGDSGKVGIEDR